MNTINLQIAISIALTILTILAIFVNTFRGRAKEQKTYSARETDGTNTDTPETNASTPPVSIVITVHDEDEEIDKNLPLFLSQDYEAEYEVIVVIEKDANNVEDILKKHMSNPKLYYTFIPQSSRYMSRKKLAITLGVKAAKHEWIILTEPTVAPESSRWLSSFAQYATEEADAVMGYTHYQDEATGYQRFETIHTALRAMRRAKRGKAFRSQAPLIAFRKKLFMQNNGFRNNQKYLRGEYDFIINDYGSKTFVADNPKAWCMEEAPSKKQWAEKHMFYQETRKHLKGKFYWRFFYNIEQILFHLSLAAIVAAITISTILKLWIVTIASVVCLFALLIFRTLIIKKTLTAYQIGIKPFAIPVHDISLMWRNVAWRIRYLRANKADFISHKV